jgi:predicted  nucleic acid-binding Zn-ribbon protein
MTRVIIEVASMLVALGIVWGDLKRQVVDIRNWVGRHSKEHERINDSLTAVKIEQGRVDQYMRDNKDSLKRIEAKLDRMSGV